MGQPEPAGAQIFVWPAEVRDGSDGQPVSG